MNDKDSIEFEGEVLQALPNTLFAVKLTNGHNVLCTLTGKLRLNRINIMPGDNVIVKLSIYDLTKGRIVRRKDKNNYFRRRSRKL